MHDSSVDERGPGAVDPAGAITEAGTDPNESSLAAEGAMSADASAGAAALGTPGRTLGRYVVLGTLGKGAMGVVLEAFDRTLDRKVALKVLRWENDRKRTARLLREAQAMAKLSHPNVVQVFEAGTVDGRTFVAMERVEGQTLREWMRQQPRPGWRRCVEVFVDVAQGLAAAHEQGLVHRDFKPSNAILDDKGRTKVLDFGLVQRSGGDASSVEGVDGTERAGDPSATGVVDGARSDERLLPGGSVLEQEPALAATLTRTGAILGTPAYMSPEQMRGRAVDARSDQFSVCVTLYEAVYGQRPFVGTTVATLMAATLDGDVRPAPAGSSVPKALRKVLLRGLALDPAKRWPSMDALLVELRRLLAPRARRGLVLGAAVVLVGAAVAVPGVVALQERCADARALLEGAWDDVLRARVRTAMLGTERAHAADVWARVEPRLDDYANGWAETHTEVCEATVVRGEQTEQTMELRMSCLHERKVAVAAAVAVLSEADDAVVGNAVTLVERLPSVDRCDDVTWLRQRRQRTPPPDGLEVARQAEDLGARLADARAEYAVGHYTESLELAEALVPEVEALGYEPLRAEALLARGRVYLEMDQLAEAEQDLERAFELAAAHGRDEVVAKAAAQLSWMKGYRQEQHESGMAWAEVALALSRSPGLEPRVEADALDNIGILLSARGKLSESLEYHQQALEILEESGESEPIARGNVLGNIATTLTRLNRLDEALSRYQRAEALVTPMTGPHHPMVAGILGNIAIVLDRQGRRDESLEYQLRTLEIFEQALGREHSSVAMTLGNIGISYFDQGQLELAREHFERARGIFERTFGPRHTATVMVMGNIAQVLQDQGKLAEARELLTDASEILEGAAEGDLRTVTFVAGTLGNVLRAQGDLEGAVKQYQQALDAQRATLGEDDPQLVPTLTRLAEIALATGDGATARARAERVLALDDEAELGGRDVAVARFVLAQVLWASGERESAVEHARRARRSLSDETSSDEVTAEIDEWLARHGRAP